MYKRILFVILMIISASCLMAQTKDYCEILRTDFQKAIDKGVVSEIDYHYFKLLNLCDVSAFEMGMLEGALNKKRFGITWQKNQSYKISFIPDTAVTPSKYFGSYVFEDLSPRTAIRIKFKTFEDFLKAIKVSEDELTLPPIFIPAYNAILVYRYGGNKVLNMTTLKVMLEEKNTESSLDYVGGGLFLTILQDRCKVHHIHHQTHKLSKIIDRAGAVYTFPIDNQKTYITVLDYTQEEYKTLMYNQEGQLLYDDYQNIEFSPLSKTIILRKDDAYTLVDYDHKPIIQDMAYIYEVWKDDMSYYVCDTKDEKRVLYDKQGHRVIEPGEFDDIHIDRTPYAIVMKNNEYAIIDFLSKEILIPFQKEIIKQLYPGYLTYEREGYSYIIDPNHYILAKIPIGNLRTLTAEGKGLIMGTNENGLVAAYDLFGNSLFEQMYNGISYSSTEDLLILTQGQVQYKATRSGKIIK